MNDQVRPSHYKAIPLTDALGNPVPWAVRISNPTIAARMHKVGIRYKPSKPESKPADGAAYIATEMGHGIIIGEYLIDHHILPRDQKIPLVYPPDSGLPVTEGIAKICKNNNIAYEIIRAEGQAFDKNPKDWGKKYTIPPDAILMAKESGMLMLCDGVLDSGRTLEACLDSLPNDFQGQVVIAVSREAMKNSHFIDKNIISGSDLIKKIESINQRKGDKLFSVKLCIADRTSKLMENKEPMPDAGDTMQNIYQETIYNKNPKSPRGLGGDLIKRDVTDRTP